MAEAWADYEQSVMDSLKRDLSAIFQSNPGRSEDLFGNLVCQGLNAPALFVRPLGRLLSSVYPETRTILGFGRDEILFLVTVPVLWYLVARNLDSWQKIPYGELSRRRLLVIALCVCLLLAGIVLLVFGVSFLVSPGRYNVPVRRIRPDRDPASLMWGAQLYIVTIPSGVTRTFTRSGKSNGVLPAKVE